MAKGYAMERWQGKKGSNVFYKISNSSNAQKQGVRERVYEVSNPKTRSQALQRMKVRAAQNFYNTLAPILNRAMQGVKYGALTRNEFMRYALSKKYSPAVSKGSNVAIPGTYLLSKGSLFAFANKAENNAPNEMHFALPVTLGEDDIWNSGEPLSQQVFDKLTANGAIKEGDQLTFIYFESNSCIYNSVLVKVGEVLSGGVTISEDDIYIEGTNTIDAAAVILSRKNGNKYERSTAYLALNEASEAIQNAYSTEAINAALATYQKSVSVNGESTDWPVEPEEGGQGSGTFSISAPYTLSGLTGAKAGLNGRKVLVFENVNTGDLTSVGTTSGYLVDFETYQTLVYMQDAVYMALVPTDVTALASLPHHEINTGI